MKIKTSAPTNEMPPQIAMHLLKGFSMHSRHYVRRHFHTIRILKNTLPEPAISFPVVIYLNHASWWDPLVCLYLAALSQARKTSWPPNPPGAIPLIGSCSKEASLESARFTMPGGGFGRGYTQEVLLAPAVARREYDSLDRGGKLPAGLGPGVAFPAQPRALRTASTDVPAKALSLLGTDSRAR